VQGTNQHAGTAECTPCPSGLLSWPRAVGGLRVLGQWRHVVALTTLPFDGGICARCRSNALVTLPLDGSICRCLSNAGIAGCTKRPCSAPGCLAPTRPGDRLCTRLAPWQALATSLFHLYHCTTGYKRAGCESVSTDRPTAAAPLACACASASTSSTVCTHIAALDSQMLRSLPMMAGGPSSSVNSQRARFKTFGSSSSRFSCSGVEPTEGMPCAAAARFLPGAAWLICDAMGEHSASRRCRNQAIYFALSPRRTSWSHQAHQARGEPCERTSA